MKNEYSDGKTRAVIYGSNLAFPVIEGAINGIFETSLKGFSNPYGAILFGGMDLLGKLTNKVKESKLLRMTKLVGAMGYASFTIGDIFSISNGNYFGAISLPFDVSMTYQLGKDVFDFYNKPENDLVEDIKGIGKNIEEKIDGIQDKKFLRFGETKKYGFKKGLLRTRISEESEENLSQ